MNSVAEKWNTHLEFDSKPGELPDSGKIWISWASSADATADSNCAVISSDDFATCEHDTLKKIF